jgi:hypothetical protein
MTQSDGLHMPRDPGSVPVTLRNAFGWVRDAERASAAVTLPDIGALETLADDSAADEARLAMVEQLLGTPGGALDLAHLVAARTSTQAADEHFFRETAAATPPRGFADGAALAKRRRRFSGLQPALLAASLMLVAGTSWYVFTNPQPSADDAIRSAATSVELLSVEQLAAGSPVTLSWKSLRADDRYTVEVLDAADAPVFAGDTHTTRLVIPAGTLKRGTYRWYVRARATDRTELRSRVASFTVR